MISSECVLKAIEYENHPYKVRELFDVSLNQYMKLSELAKQKMFESTIFLLRTYTVEVRDVLRSCYMLMYKTQSAKVRTKLVMNSNLMFFDTVILYRDNFMTFLSRDEGWKLSLRKLLQDPEQECVVCMKDVQQNYMYTYQTRCCRSFICVSCQDALEVCPVCRKKEEFKKIISVKNVAEEQLA